MLHDGTVFAYLLTSESFEQAQRKPSFYDAIAKPYKQDKIYSNHLLQRCFSKCEYIPNFALGIDAQYQLSCHWHCPQDSLSLEDTKSPSW